MLVWINSKNDLDPVSPDNGDYRERNCTACKNSLESKKNPSCCTGHSPPSLTLAPSLNRTLFASRKMQFPPDRPHPVARILIIPFKHKSGLLSRLPASPVNLTIRARRPGDISVGSNI